MKLKYKIFRDHNTFVKFCTSKKYKYICNSLDSIYYKINQEDSMINYKGNNNITKEDLEKIWNCSNPILTNKNIYNSLWFDDHDQSIEKSIIIGYNDYEVAFIGIIQLDYTTSYLGNKMNIYPDKIWQIENFNGIEKDFEKIELNDEQMYILNNYELRNKLVWYIYDVIVDFKYRKKGICTKLIKLLINEALNSKNYEKNKMIITLINNENKNSIKCFMKNGFVKYDNVSSHGDNLYYLLNSK